jgi:transcriptional regulator with XRE-family HTH domain
MPSTVEYLDAIKAHRHLTHDSDLARLLGVQRQTISRYRLMPVSMDDDVAMKAANLLGIRPATILLDMYAERQRNPAIKAVWREAADELREHAH